MAKRQNYGFQKQQKELKRQKKREEKAEKKRLKADAVPTAVDGETEPQDDERA